MPKFLANLKLTKDLYDFKVNEVSIGDGIKWQ